MVRAELLELHLLRDRVVAGVGLCPPRPGRVSGRRHRPHPSCPRCSRRSSSTPADRRRPVQPRRTSVRHASTHPGGHGDWVAPALDGRHTHDSMVVDLPRTWRRRARIVVTAQSDPHRGSGGRLGSQRPSRRSRSRRPADERDDRRQPSERAGLPRRLAARLRRDAPRRWTPADRVWQGTFALPAGSFEYKAALNDAWTRTTAPTPRPTGPTSR